MILFFSSFTQEDINDPEFSQFEAAINSMTRLGTEEIKQVPKEDFQKPGEG